MPILMVWPCASARGVTAGMAATAAARSTAVARRDRIMGKASCTDGSQMREKVSVVRDMSERNVAVTVPRLAQTPDFARLVTGGHGKAFHMDPGGPIADFSCRRTCH